MITSELHLVKWPLTNPDSGILTSATTRWADAERVEGDYDFSNVYEAVRMSRQIGRCAMLRIDARTPLWAIDTTRSFCAFLNALGNRFDGEPAIFSVDVTPPDDTDFHADNAALHMISDAYMSSFPNTYKLLDMRCGKLASYMKDFDGVGLALDADMGGARIDAIMRQYNLCDVWEKAPVRLTAKRIGAELINEAVNWHVSVMDTDEKREFPGIAGIGHRIAVRRVSSPAEVKRGDTAVFVIDIVNLGNAPCYSGASFKLRLSRTVGDEYVWQFDADTKRLLPGSERSMTFRVPTDALPTGEYGVHIGLFCDTTGYPVAMGNVGRISDGFFDTFIKACIML